LSLIFPNQYTLNTADRCIDLIIYETKFLELLDHINNDICTIQISTSHKKREPVHCLTWHLRWNRKENNIKNKQETMTIIVLIMFSTIPFSTLNTNKSLTIVWHLQIRNVIILKVSKNQSKSWIFILLTIQIARTEQSPKRVQPTTLINEFKEIQPNPKACYCIKTWAKYLCIWKTKTAKTRHAINDTSRRLAAEIQHCRRLNSCCK